MKHQSLIALSALLLLVITACSSHRKIDGWYPIAVYPDTSVVGKPLVTVKDFEDVVMLRDSHIMAGDTVTQVVIQGRVRPEKRRQWADGTERLIGQRLGFVYNDSVVIAPQVNARLESGAFQIISPDTVLLRNIYNSIKQQIKQL